MRNKIKLSEATTMYLSERSAEGTASTTLRNHRDVLRRLQRSTGDLLTENLSRQHFSAYLALTAETRSAGINVDYSVLRVFTEWCVVNGYMGRYENPMQGRKRPRYMPTERRRLSVTKFGALLEAAEEHDSRDRAVVALGLYLFLRAAEIKDLRMRDLNLADGYISVRVFKTKQLDQMPISLELDRELRRWLTYYTEKAGQVPADDWRLIPGYLPRIITKDGQPLHYNLLKPTAPVACPERIVQRALIAVGWDTRTSEGVSLREGVHTLRRSGARALFDHLVDQSYDGALRRVQAMLHHSGSKMTEHYLGIEIDRHQRNELIRGVEMFPVATDNVVQLRSNG